MMDKKLIIRNAGLMVMFLGAGFFLLTENMGIAHKLGLFACGVGFGAALTVIIRSCKSKQTKV
jgi:hypothetical protein